MGGTSTTTVSFDRWRELPHYELPHEWIGVTIFRTLGDFPDELPDEVTCEPDARPASTLPVPTEPSQAEKLRHELTHLPYQPWCSICVGAKGKQPHHKTLTSRIPLVQIDYAFAKLQPDGEDTTILTMINVTTGMTAAYAIDTKSPTRFHVEAAKNFLQDTGRTEAL
jgi:hypothetical protein